MYPKTNFIGFVKKTINIKTSTKRIWQKISDIADLDWVAETKNTVYCSTIKQGIGAIREITLADGNKIKEHIVGWKNRKYLSYIAVSGLPLRAYHATISIKPKNRKSALLIWQSYFNSQKMTKNEFNEFCSFLEQFYQVSLKNLKATLEH